MAPFSRRGFIEAVAGSALLAPFIARAEGTAGHNDAELYQVTHTELHLAGIDPAHDGLRIAQLSDIHIGANTPDGRIISAIRKVNELKPDLVFLTGDFVTHRRDPFDRIPIVLEGIEAKVFTILGNHDHWGGADKVRGGLQKAGYAVLQNEHTVTRARGADLTILGVDDGATRHDDVEKTFKGAATTGTRLVMAHTPPTADKLPENQNLACFSGHTHGGQFYVPGLTESIYRRAGQPYVRGHHFVRGNQLYVNRGLGFGRGGPVLRMGSDPELSVFTLRLAT